MKGCIFITMHDCRHGFSLAGFQQLVADHANILDMVTEIVRGQEPGIVFIDERLLAENIMGRLQLLEKQWGGAFIALPAPGRPDEPVHRDTGKRFIARVLGYQMKLS